MSVTSKIRKFSASTFWNGTDGKNELALRAARKFFVMDNQKYNDTTTFVGEVRTAFSRAPFNCPNCTNIGIALMMRRANTECAFRSIGIPSGTSWRCSSPLRLCPQQVYCCWDPEPIWHPIMQFRSRNAVPRVHRKSYNQHEQYADPYFHRLQSGLGGQGVSDYEHCGGPR